MKFPASGGGDFDPLAEGVHIGVLDMIVDLGVQPPRGVYGPKHEVYFRWQVPAERIEYTKDGKTLEGPRVVGQSYTASMSPKANLRKMIENFRGRKFANDGEAEAYDIEKLLGHACQIQVTHSKDGKYANVVGVMALPKGMAEPSVENGTLFYDTANDSTYAKLPQWLRDKIDTQLDPSQVVKPKAQQQARPVSRAAASGMTASEIEAAEQEASRQAAKDDGAPFDDELNF